MKTNEVNVKEALQLCAILMALLLSLIIAIAVLPPLPTILEATSQVLAEYPVCVDQVEVIQEQYVYGYWSASPNVATRTLVVCEAANVRIVVQGQ